MPLTTTDAYAADMFAGGMHYQQDMIEAAAQAEVGFDSVCFVISSNPKHALVDVNLHLCDLNRASKE